MEGMNKERTRKYGMNLLFLLQPCDKLNYKARKLRSLKDPVVKKQILMPPRYEIVRYVL